MIMTSFLSLVLFHACINILAENYSKTCVFFLKFSLEKYLLANVVLEDILRTRNSQKPLPFCDFATVTFEPCNLLKISFSNIENDWSSGAQKKGKLNAHFLYLNHLFEMLVDFACFRSVTSGAL